MTGEAIVPAQQLSHRPRPLSETTIVMVGVAVEGRDRTWTRGEGEATGVPAEAQRKPIAIQVMIKSLHPVNLYGDIIL